MKWEEVKDLKTPFKIYDLVIIGEVGGVFNSTSSLSRISSLSFSLISTFHVHLVGDQEQVDLVVLEFEGYAMTWWLQICMNSNDQEPPTAS